MEDIKKIIENTHDEAARKLLQQLVSTCAEQSKKIRILEEHNKKITQVYCLIKKRLFGVSSEQVKYSDIPQQMLCDVFDEFELAAIEIDEEDNPNDGLETTVAKRKKSGRKPLPKALPRTVVEHDLTDDEKKCACGSGMKCIGFDTSEELDYTPPKVEVIEHHTKKYCCVPCAEAAKNDPEMKARFKIANRPLQIIPKSFASPSLLASIIIAKFCDHMPLYRLEASFKRLGITLSRQTMSNWVLKLGEAVIPLVNLMQEYILEYDIAFADETPLQVLNEPGRKATAKSYMWLFIGGPPDKRALIYQYHQTRSADAPEAFFDGYKGALHCDGYSGYNGLLTSVDIVGLNCWAHVRRKFLESIPKGAKITGVAGYVLSCITALYKIEDMFRKQSISADTIKKIRQEKAKPILLKYKAYLDEKVSMVPPASKLGEAIAYTLKRWPYLVAYIEDGRYEIDNNRTERGIKPFVMGRKAWLFANSMAGAHASCRLFSLIETAKASQLNPNKYLEYIFKELPSCKTVEDYERLLPWSINDVHLK